MSNPSVEEFLAKQRRYRCLALSADLTEAQCAQNRSRVTDLGRNTYKIQACDDCAGLGKAVELVERIAVTTQLKGNSMPPKYASRECIVCHEVKRHHGRGMCPKCYTRAKKYGKYGGGEEAAEGIIEREPVDPAAVNPVGLTALLPVVDSPVMIIRLPADLSQRLVDLEIEETDVINLLDALCHKELVRYTCRRTV